MNPSSSKSSSIVPRCLKLEDPETKIFLRNHDLIVAIENFMAQRNEFWNVMQLAGDVIQLIHNLLLSLEGSKNWKEATFWYSQISRLCDQSEKLHRLFDLYPGSEAVVSKMVVGLDCKGFEKLKGDVKVVEYKDKTEETN